MLNFLCMFFFTLARNPFLEKNFLDIIAYSWSPKQFIYINEKGKNVTLNIGDSILDLDLGFLKLKNVSKSYYTMVDENEKNYLFYIN